MSLSNKLFLSRPVILEMLNDRGYNTAKYDDFTFKEIDIMLKTIQPKNKDISSLDIEINSENESKLLVKYVLTSKIRVSNIITLTDSIIEEYLSEGDTLIIIIKDKLTDDSKLEAFFKQIYDKQNIFIQYFWINSLTLNITNHERVPKHELISEEEKQQMLKNSMVSNESKIPTIKMTEPVSKYYGIKEGQVFKITRNSETSGKYVTYRICKFN
tara:strand:+ start:698 stop:1339 length:642 start_codon:yes stop_codon:yes gene_type:complete